MKGMSKRHLHHQQHHIPVFDRAAKGDTKNGTSVLRLFLLIFLGVCTFIRKTIYLIYDKGVNWDRFSTYFWLPSLFLNDGLVLLLLERISRRNFGLDRNHRLAAAAVCIFLCLVYSLMCAMDESLMIDSGLEVPWQDAASAIYNYDEYIGLIGGKSEEGSAVLFIALIFQFSWAFGLTFVWNALPWKATTVLQKIPRRVRYSTLLYFVGSLLLRPIDPFQQHSSAPLISTPTDFLIGFLPHKRPHLTKAHQGSWVSKYLSSFDKDISYNENDLNVVFIFLESVPSYIMPFNTTSDFAKKYAKKDMAKRVSPFLQSIVGKSEASLHFPDVRNAALVSMAAILSSMCSIMPHPQDYSFDTGNKTIYHDCLAHILRRQGYRTEFFSSFNSNWANTESLYRKLGFPPSFKPDDYQKHYNLTSDLYSIVPALEGIADELFVDPILDWVRNATFAGNISASKDEPKRPFFITHTTTSSHDPFIPAKAWKTMEFSENDKVNGYLNTIASTDQFLKDLVERFQGLQEKTLFVFMGDHGVSLYDRGNEFTVFKQHHEKPYHVGSVFYSENKCLQGLFMKAKRHARDARIQADLLPTILQLLHHCNGKKFHSETLDRKNFDGRSMLEPAGNRLMFSYNNPMDAVVFRDRERVLVQYPQPKIPQFFDLNKDPNQLAPRSLSRCGSTKKLDDPHLEWACRASRLVTTVKDDIIRSYARGKRCENCALSDLLTLESLDGLEGFREQKPPTPKEGQEASQSSTIVESRCDLRDVFSCSNCVRVWKEGDEGCGWQNALGPLDRNLLTPQERAFDCVDTSSWCASLLASRVKCGNHFASSCGLCTAGDKGWHYCNGECQWCPHGGDNIFLSWDPVKRKLLETSQCIPKSGSCRAEAANYTSYLVEEWRMRRTLSCTNPVCQLHSVFENSVDSEN